MDESIHVGNNGPATQKPPLRVGRIAGEILAGTAGGLAVSLPAAYMMTKGRVFEDIGTLADIVVVFFVSSVAYILGSAVGVYLTGKRGQQTGSFSVTLLCSLGGGVIMFVLLPLVLVRVGPRLSGAAATSVMIPRYILSVPVLLIPPIGATWGFNLTRKLAPARLTWFRGSTLVVLLLAACPTLLIGIREFPRLRAQWQMDRMNAGAAPLVELIERLQSSDLNVRATAANALAKLGPEAKPAVPALTEALRRWDPGSSALYALAAIGPDAESAIPALVEAIRRAPRIMAEGNRELDSFQSVAGRALARIGPPSLPALNELLKDESVFARRCAAEAFGKMGPGAKAAVPALVSALKDEDEVVRQRARAALERIDPNWNRTVKPE